MNSEQLEYLHEVDRGYEQEVGPLNETMLELRALMGWVLEVGGRICYSGVEDSGISLPSNVKGMPEDIRV